MGLAHADDVCLQVVHDRKSAEEASKELDLLMTSPPHYGTKEMLIIGGMCSSFICCM